MMKKLIIFALMLVSFQVSAQQLLVGSYNIRNKNANDSIKGEVWSKRCQVICDQVLYRRMPNPLPKTLSLSTKILIRQIQ